MLNIQDHIKNAADGSFDKKATLASAQKALRAMVNAYVTKSSKSTNSNVERELDAVFDAEEQGVTLKTSTIVFRILKARGDVDGETYVAANKEVSAFIKASPRFETHTGRGIGGVTRVSPPNPNVEATEEVDSMETQTETEVSAEASSGSDEEPEALEENIEAAKAPRRGRRRHASSEDVNLDSQAAE